MTEDIERMLVDFVSEQLGTSRFTIEHLTRSGIGRSRENWVFDLVGADTREPLILRRDPEGGLVATDRSVEFAVLEALTADDIPAPAPRWLDATGKWLGRPSLVMRREPGACDYAVLNGNRPLADRVQLAHGFCDLLARVHRVDWERLGLGRTLTDPGRDAARVALDEWVQVLRRDQLEPYPELELAISWFGAHAPASPRTVLVHADFKPGNVLLEGDRIVALLDWELAHLGDPREDLGWVTQPLRRREHLIDGAWEREDLLDRYARATGLQIDRASLAWWTAFAAFKTAVMQVSGLRSFVEGRSDEPYRPTGRVLATLLRAIGTGEPEGQSHATHH